MQSTERNHAKPPVGATSSQNREGREATREMAKQRTRTFSNTSTRGAFLLMHDDPISTVTPTNTLERRKNRRRTNQNTPEWIGGSESSNTLARIPSMGEMASMAVASLDEGGHVVDVETPVLRNRGPYGRRPIPNEYHQQQPPAAPSSTSFPLEQQQRMFLTQPYSQRDPLRYFDHHDNNSQMEVFRESTSFTTSSDNTRSSSTLNPYLPYGGSDIMSSRWSVSSQPQPQPPNYGAVPLPPPQQPYPPRQQEIVDFSNMVHQKGSSPITPVTQNQLPNKKRIRRMDSWDSDATDGANLHGDDHTEYFENEDHRVSVALNRASGFRRVCLRWVNCWEKSNIIRHFFYDYKAPEFTSLQQFSWCIIVGLFMGILTALWTLLLDVCLNTMWITVPTTLREWGFFTDLGGVFPLYHYMWICPAGFGAILSYIQVRMPNPVPGQNEWIHSLHTKGVQDYEHFWSVIWISTAGMASGLSLGPELPLVLAAGMAGSWLGTVTKQSVLQARAMNLTAGSAAIGGFFGFPMAGAFFVLEIPHRMGLQYFEALSPGTMGSIVAVLANQLILQDDVSGYYTYPHLTVTLPSNIFWIAIVLGLYGSYVGRIYASGVMRLKSLVHNIFRRFDEEEQNHHHEEQHAEGHDEQQNEASRATDQESHEERLSLLRGGLQYDNKDSWAPPTTVWNECRNFWKGLYKFFCCVIPYEPLRAAVAGGLAGALVGVTGMFLPHVMFWGERQLQTIIDQGETPLPYFNPTDNPDAVDLYALAYCINGVGYSLGCSFSITMAKIFVTGLSVGTGIVGGHFWGPLFTGCIASHFLTTLAITLNELTGTSLFAMFEKFPTISILCTMGSAHVVTFRAHVAIMLILTLTISSFESKLGDDDRAGSVDTPGDYSAVFPLLVCSVFIALYHSRDLVFYKEQRSRGDIMAIPEALCEPGKAGKPMIIHYDTAEAAASIDEDDEATEDGGDDGDDDGDDDDEPGGGGSRSDDQESETEMMDAFGGMVENASERKIKDTSPIGGRPTLSEECKRTSSLDEGTRSSFVKLDELLLGQPPLETTPKSDPRKRSHRRISSAPDFRNLVPESSAPDSTLAPLVLSRGKSAATTTKQKGRTSYKRVQEDDAASHTRKYSNGSVSSTTSRKVITSFGEIADHQPSLMDQARMGAASTVRAEAKQRREFSNSGVASPTNSVPPVTTDDDVAICTGDVERTFSSIMNVQTLSAGNHQLPYRPSPSSADSRKSK